MILIKITKLAILMNKIHEIYYVYFNSYRLKIKKPGSQIPVYFICINHSHTLLLGVHGDQEFFI